MDIVVYVSSHGFGHAVRSTELIQALTARQADARIVIRTSAPRWLFARIESPRIVVEPCDTDPGLVESDGLTIDERATAARAAVFYRESDRRVADERARLNAIRPAIVVGDIPPLGFAAAREAGMPSAAVANFMWDWVYAYYPEFEALAPGVLGTISGAYAGATVALRLPLGGGFGTMPGVVEDVPFITRRSVRDPAETRRLLNIDPVGPLVLWSFGGSGIAPGGASGRSGLSVLVPPRIMPAELGHEDLVAAADIVVSKPGYGIV